MKKKRSYTQQEKQQILDEVKAVKNISAVAKKNTIPVETIHTWLKKLKSKNHSQIITDEHRELKKINDDLILENRILKDLLKKTIQVLA